MRITEIIDILYSTGGMAEVGGAVHPHRYPTHVKIGHVEDCFLSAFCSGTHDPLDEATFAATQ